MGDGRENVGAMGRRPLDAVSVVNAAFPRLVVDIEVLKIVVEVDAARAEVATQECRVCGEYGGDVNVAFPAKRYGHADLPFVEMGNYGLGKLSGDVLYVSRGQ